MAGYTRQSQAQILNGEIVSAPPINAEFNQVVAAFNNTTGHKHDGSVGEGAPIDRLADADQNNKMLVNTSANQLEFYTESSAASVLQFIIQNGVALPNVTDTFDLGTSSVKYKDLYLGGTLYSRELVVTGSSSTIGALTVTSTGATIDGFLTVTGHVTADTIGTNTLTAATGNLTSVDIDGGNIDGTAIGASTPSSGNFTTVDIDAGTIDGATVGATTPATGAFTTLEASSVSSTGNVTVLTSGSGFVFPDGSIQYKAGTVVGEGVSAGKAIALAMIFGG